MQIDAIVQRLPRHMVARLQLNLTASGPAPRHGFAPRHNDWRSEGPNALDPLPRGDSLLRIVG
jgi:hypothetical protein